MIQDQYLRLTLTVYCMSAIVNKDFAKDFCFVLEDTSRPRTRTNISGYEADQRRISFSNLSQCSMVVSVCSAIVKVNWNFGNTKFWYPDSLIPHAINVKFDMGGGYVISGVAPYIKYCKKKISPKGLAGKREKNMKCQFG